MAKMTLLVAAAAGYVLGARAGRERYDEISATAQRIWGNPKVQEKRAQAREATTRAGRAAGETVSEKASRITGRSESERYTPPPAASRTSPGGDSDG